MHSLSPQSRVALGVSYAAVIVLPCLLIALFPYLPRLLGVATFLAYAFALLPTYYLDHWLLGGIGYHSVGVFGLLALVIALMLWPFLLLTMAPSTLSSIHWRRLFLGYGILFGLGALFAAWQMTRSWGLFFG